MPRKEPEVSTVEEAPGRPTAADSDEEARRQEAVRRYAALETASGGAFDRVAALAARIFHAPFATVTIVGDDRVRVIAAHGPSARRAIFRSPIAGSPFMESPVVESPVVVSLCAAAVRHDGPHAVSDALLHPGSAGDPAVRGEPGIRFHAAAPIVTPDGEPLGSVNVMDTRPREAGEEELACLRDLAGLVMDELQVRLVTQRTVEIERQLRAGAERLARTLQRTLLPPALPRVPGLRAAAAYHPVSADEVGGDFYDLFPLDGDRWGFFLGDVCGKGAGAASLTSLVRYTLRAAAVYDADPHAVLANLDAVLQQEHAGGDMPAPYCTAVFGVLQPDGDGFGVTLATGGHPPALAVRADGLVEPIHPAGGQLIGILRNPHFAQVSARLNAGDALLLYTDGLTEARTETGSMLDEDGLTAYLAAAGPTSADALLDTVHDLITDLGEGVSDDAAVLALSVPPATRSSFSGSQGAA
ncbi:GAF domain-containing protein [Microbispora triticiradicis]|uniref:GAF domain-containing protein n=1 Tax=Microbispora triticiradicis TaxID=2200763 RepID=A0ABX9LRD6_9ACTN|nr:GAF domain-containing SpoIIE family protein phosphatase [Microbispora triticiradicis]RGA06582.1 GAF domain-containing protein [Microbispora triticiradicis]